PCFLYASSGHHHHLHSFPTRRSSDLLGARDERKAGERERDDHGGRAEEPEGSLRLDARGDRQREHGDENAVRTEHDADIALAQRSEEHTSELQSPYDLVCRLLLEKKK